MRDNIKDNEDSISMNRISSIVNLWSFSVPSFFENIDGEFTDVKNVTMYEAAEFVYFLLKHKKGDKPLAKLLSKKIESLEAYIAYHFKEMGKPTILKQEKTEINGLPADYFQLETKDKSYVHDAYSEKDGYFYCFRIIVPIDRKFDFLEQLDDFIFSIKLEKTDNSDKFTENNNEAANDYSYNDEQLRALTACSVLMLDDAGKQGILMFPFPKKNRLVSPKEAKKRLSEWWGIENKTESVDTLADLSNADCHTPLANEIYNNLIAKSGQELLDINTFESYDEFEQVKNLSLKIAENNFSEFMESNKIPKDDEEDAFNHFTRLIFIDRINDALIGYKSAVEFLKGFGYTTDELNKISDFSAWDYARCGFVARMSAHVGYINEQEGWSYMLAAGENAAKIYESWREFLAAFFLGREIAYYNEDLDEWEEAVEYLLKDRNSPFQKVEFKLG